MELKEKIIDLLKQCYDPEIPVDLWSLGLIYDINIKDKDDKEVLEDLIIAAINDARAKVDKAVNEKMSELTGGLQLPPGLKLPF